mmetsp:Transcript_13093/g.29812  ORF Transcript_13093/g.29812 Transcript_13093/m.29812 type:complete len:202 (-) Transcript_13093:232-837(-)
MPHLLLGVPASLTAVGEHDVPLVEGVAAPLQPRDLPLLGRTEADAVPQRVVPSGRQVFPAEVISDANLAEEVNHPQGLADLHGPRDVLLPLLEPRASPGLSLAIQPDAVTVCGGLVEVGLVHPVQGVAVWQEHACSAELAGRRLMDQVVPASAVRARVRDDAPRLWIIGDGAVEGNPLGGLALEAYPHTLLPREARLSSGS